MSKKKRNRKKYNSNKYKTKTSKDKKLNKLDLKQQEFEDRQKIRNEKKIWLWLLLFPPIGIYRCFKYGAFKKWITTIITILFTLILILSADMMLYPHRVIDSKVEKMFNELNEYGICRDLENIGVLDNSHYIYNIISTKGEYDVYVSGENKKVEISGINKISPDRKMEYADDTIKDIYKKLYPEIIRFFNSSEIVDKYGEIKEVIESTSNSQTLKTEKGTYTFNLAYEQIESIYEHKPDGQMEKVYGKKAVINLPKQVEKVLEDREDTLGKLAEVISYKLTESTREYVIITHSNTYYKIVLDDDGTVTIYNADNNLN